MNQEQKKYNPNNNEHNLSRRLFLIGGFGLVTASLIETIRRLTNRNNPRVASPAALKAIEESYSNDDAKPLVAQEIADAKRDKYVEQALLQLREKVSDPEREEITSLIERVREVLISPEADSYSFNHDQFIISRCYVKGSESSNQDSNSENGDTTVQQVRYYGLLLRYDKSDFQKLGTQVNIRSVELNPESISKSSEEDEYLYFNQLNNQPPIIRLTEEGIEYRDTIDSSGKTALIEKICADLYEGERVAPPKKFAQLD